MQSCLDGYFVHSYFNLLVNNENVEEIESHFEEPLKVELQHCRNVELSVIPIYNVME